jgi:hypothetical protein
MKAPLQAGLFVERRGLNETAGFGCSHGPVGRSEERATGNVATGGRLFVSYSPLFARRRRTPFLDKNSRRICKSFLGKKLIFKTNRFPP